MNGIRAAFFLALASLFLVAIGCGESEPATPTATPTATPSPTPTMTPSPPPTATPTPGFFGRMVPRDPVGQPDPIKLLVNLGGLLGLAMTFGLGYWIYRI